MLFSSIPFLYYFLPCTLLLYFLSPKKGKNIVLLISSLVFYAWGEPKNIILMLISILSGYLFGLLIEKFRGGPFAKVFLGLSVFVSIGMLAVFKYTDFFISNINTFTKASIPLLKIALPIGISFYTFQILSYTIDVYRGSVPAQKNFISLATYIALFPQLIAGPIVRYIDIEKQLKDRPQDFEHIAIGIRRFIIGLSKKVLLANAFGELTSIIQASSDPSVLFYWLYAVSFTLQIYFDFSGYSDMAIGLGKIFGFTFLENFNYPYISKSITEFWRRWHISLGSWFRDYVYIPLGGNRCGKGKWLRNILVVWFLTGFWHGASWNFILWGLFYAVLLLLEKFFLLKYLEKSKVLSHVYVMLFVIFGFVLFNADTLSDAVKTIKGMLGLLSVPAISTEFIYYLKSFGFTLILGILASTPLCKKLYLSVSQKKTGAKMLNLLEIPFLLLLFITVTAYLVDGSFNPFLYFRF